MTDALAEKLAHLPTQPGVYQHKDAGGTILYVGKAKNLRNRVRSYFQESRPRDARLRILVSKIVDVEVIVTDTEAEALILENNLIKRHQPRYNVNLKDDKTYPYICIKRERFPRVFPTRTVRKDGSEYFGPYTDGKALKLMLKTIKDLFKLRTCSLRLSKGNVDAGKFEPCLEYHIQNCKGPCVGYQAEEDYDAAIDQIRQLLNGKTKALVGIVKDEMQAAAMAKDFERAAELRDRMRALQKYAEKQKVVTTEEVDRDLFALAIDREDDAAVGVLFKVREGKIIGRQHKILRRFEGVEDTELMQRFVEAHYADATFFPDEVYLSHDVEAPDPIEAVLREGRGKKVPLKTPARGEKASLMRMVEANADLLLGEWKRQKIARGEERIPRSVTALQRDLGLKKPPRRIECFDISHLGGTGTVASCVVFEDGKPKKSDYRTYKIRSVPDGKPDDFQSMREATERRYNRMVQENGPWPDLVIIDGGKGQLSSVMESLKRTEVLGRFAIVSLAKRLEEVYKPGLSDPVMIPRTSSSLRLLQRARDEAHRFAVTAQRKQRAIKTLRTELTEIDGIGPKTARKLLSTFGSVKGVQAASEEALADEVGPSAARKVRAYFDAPPTERAENQA
ncbi:MAG: excinuclease ABC subunit UvrC [Bacteroidota bacterium]